MSDDVLIRRTHTESVAADNSHGAEWGARPAPRNTTGANVTIQKNWQELISTEQVAGERRRRSEAGRDRHC